MNTNGDRKRICLSIAAHVDAGKTTLAEAMMYEAGALKSRGRVDHRDSSLDYEDFERARGITAFSKQAVFSYGRTDFSVIDTPGHTDLFAETRRGLTVPDAAVLVISGSEGIQADTGTVWKLLEEQKIPTWIFVSKMDLTGSDRHRLLKELRERFSGGVTDFTVRDEEIGEAAAELDETCMEEYLNAAAVSDGALAHAIAARTLFPCYFGSGLKLDGVRRFLEGLDRWIECPERPEAFSARCYKISRDARGQRMTQVKITGGRLNIRDTVRYRTAGGSLKEEKITGIRIYSGVRYEQAETVEAGQACSLLGLSETAAGSLIGEDAELREENAEAVRRFTLAAEGRPDPVVLLSQLKQLSEELPELRPEAGRNGISVCLTGKIQGEMLKALLQERFGVTAWLEEGRLIYRETIAGRVEGIGHFEPLRHYAEVHLILEPGPAGSGVMLESACPEDMLERNWQNLILDALREGPLPGVLTGSELTDIRISLASGRAHQKHTEGGDFREAARRAVRQGLMQAESILLEPVYRFEMTLPANLMGRAISDMKSMHAELENPEQEGDAARLAGTVAVSEFGEYPEQLLSYTRGLGKITVHPAGYQPCRRAQEVLDETEYRAERDTEWPADSVFCAHGAGFAVSWRDVRDYMHLPSVLEEQNRKQQTEVAAHRLERIDDRELEAIMLREFGPVKRPEYGTRSVPAETRAAADREAPGTHTLVVDGYNFIFSQPELKQTAQYSLSAARELLMDRLSNYCGFTGRKMVLVFDGFRTAGNPGSRDLHANIHVVFTPEGESADAYIEGLVSRIGKNDRVSVVTADTMIRISAMRSGVLRISPDEFRTELEEAEEQLSRILAGSNDRAHLTRGENAIVKGREEIGYESL